MAKLRPLWAPPLFISVIISSAAAQPPAVDTQVTFRPSAGVVGGIFTVMFTLTLLLLLYAKLCHRAVARNELFGSDPELDRNLLNLGVDKTVIESLPLFRFASLRGARGGLECAVCLSRFEDTEFLRLLPTCKHAFHMHCVDLWLQTNSTCPLCRHRVTADDAAGFKNLSLSSRFPMLDYEGDNNNGVVDLFVERVLPEGSGKSGRLGGSFRKVLNFSSSRKDEPLMALDNEHRLKHRIIVSDVVMRSRWSDVNSADIISLNCDMLNVLSSKRFEPPLPADDVGTAKFNEAILERKRVLESKESVTSNLEQDVSDEPTPSLVSPAIRCMSEITDVSRFSIGRALTRDQSHSSNSSGNDVRVRRVWLPIVRQTVQRFNGRVQRSSSKSVQRKDSHDTGIV